MRKNKVQSLSNVAKAKQSVSNDANVETCVCEGQGRWSLYWNIRRKAHCNKGPSRERRWEFLLSLNHGGVCNRFTRKKGTQDKQVETPWIKWSLKARLRSRDGYWLRRRGWGSITSFKSRLDYIEYIWAGKSAKRL